MKLRHVLSVDNTSSSLLLDPQFSFFDFLNELFVCDYYWFYSFVASRKMGKFYSDTIKCSF